MSASRFNIWSRSLSLGATSAVVLALGASGCKSGSMAAKEDLALAPKDAAMVFGINVARMRTTPVWKKLTDFISSSPSQKKDYDDMAANCLDFVGPTGPDSVFMAVPSTTGGRDFEVIVHLKTAIDEAQVNKCATYGATKSDDKVTITEYGGKKIYGSQKSADKDGGIVMLDGKTFVVASGSWIHQVIDLATSKTADSAKTNELLAGLVKRAKTTDAVWGVGLVPQAARDSLKGDPRLAPMASLQSVVGSLDFATGFRADIDMDTSVADDAKKLNDLVTSQLGELKKSPQVMMLGVAQYLDGVKTEAKGPVFHVELKYTQEQFDEMTKRIMGMVQSFANSLGGGMGGGIPGGGPGMGGAPMGGPGMGGAPMGGPGMGAVPPSEPTQPGMPGQLKLSPPSGAGTPGAAPTLGMPGLKQPPAAPPAVAPPPPSPAH